MHCIVWRSDTELLIGCLDGCVHQWEVGGATRDLLHLQGSVLHMQFDHQFKVYIHNVLAYTDAYTTHTHTHKHWNQQFSYWQLGPQREC